MSAGFTDLPGSVETPAHPPAVNRNRPASKMNAIKNKETSKIETVAFIQTLPICVPEY